jgi:Ice-binding-like
MASPGRISLRGNHRAGFRWAWTALVVALLPAGLVIAGAGSAQALATAVPLGTSESFAVLSGSGITNTGPTTITGDVGTAPNPSITGMAQITLIGSYHQADAQAVQAKSDLVVAYNNAAGQARDADSGAELGGQTLVAGVYGTDSSLGLTGTVTLDGQGATDGVWVFQAGSTLITASSSTVLLINGAQACNVYWQVGSSATLGTSTDFAGTVLALTSITATTGATIQGRLLARNGAVTLDTNTITRSACSAPTTPGTTTSATPATGNPATTASTTTATAVPLTAAPSTAALGTVASATGTPGSSTGDRGTGSEAPVVGQVAEVPVGALDTGDGSASDRDACHS